MTKKYNIAVVGATGNVGRETLEILFERSLPINNIYAIASSESNGKEVSFGDGTIKISDIDSVDFSKIDIAFFSAGSEISKKYIPMVTKQGCVVIDKSSFFRLDPDVPLIVPEANLASLKDYTIKNIIANPNCCTVPIATALKPLDNAVKIKRLVISTYQSASGAGKKGMEELYEQTKAKYVFKDIEPKVFPHQIAFNLFPHIGSFNKDGSTSEESKIALELEKIIGTHAKASVTCVRVPVFVGHAISVNVEFSGAINAEEVKEILKESDSIEVNCHLDPIQYVTPKDVVGTDMVYVSRIRQDHSQKNTINLWITADNLRKGAALNAVHIAEELIKYI
ncbi:aspartate-semialdehyde dehydrogenase [Rickettsia endosymbiont of Culicoides newsteadi]|uniref:aspartate-semialdehyde dehydrogenase n=1 Tax=Rickettsia endosymbiont of Culicoides newsteadi TaxID=1961830 RepID=UPI000B9C583F|nr:aspartate-semialdehyde dehydrogenase [Rickettsia endosymbiont of Culicoides newsteadi]OZG31315.1 aspartate-semialdehyde dehydrogenase [Rickettsia endosymbiont of Culicoides newsteadi]